MEFFTVGEEKMKLDVMRRPLNNVTATVKRASSVTSTTSSQLVDVAWRRTI